MLYRSWLTVFFILAILVLCPAQTIYAASGDVAVGKLENNTLTYKAWAQWGAIHSSFILFEDSTPYELPTNNYDYSSNRNRCFAPGEIYKFPYSFHDSGSWTPLSGSLEQALNGSRVYAQVYLEIEGSSKKRIGIIDKGRLCKMEWRLDPLGVHWVCEDYDDIGTWQSIPVFGADISHLEPNKKYNASIYIQDVIGVLGDDIGNVCGPVYGSSSTVEGDIVASNDFYIIRGNTCDISISPNSYSYTLDVGAGGMAIVGASISEASDKPVRWTLSIGGQTFNGSGNNVSVNWNGLDTSGKAETKTYTATFHAETTDGECEATETFTITVRKAEDCKLRVTVGSAANVASGELTDTLGLFAIPGNGPSHKLTLSYASRDAYNGPLGIGWRHSYDIHLEEIASGGVVVSIGNSPPKLFTPNGSGYRSQPGDYSTLSKKVDGTFVLTFRDGLAYNFNNSGQISSIIDRNNNALTFTYLNGLLTEATDYDGRTVVFEHDSTGKLVSVTDPVGNVYGFTITGNALENLTLPDGEQWFYSYDANVYLASKVDPVGNITQYYYDSQHRLVEVVDPQDQLRTISYPVASQTVQTTLVTEKDNSVWQYKYDTQSGNLLSKTDPSGNATSYVHDTNHNIIEKIEPGIGTTSYRYDGHGNMVQVVSPTGQETTYTYNNYGQVTSITDTDLKKTSYIYDPQGNLVEVESPDGIKTTYRYDDQGRLISLLNATGQTTELGYDANGNVEYVVGADGNKTYFGYDDNGNRTSINDADGKTVEYKYNLKNQVEEVIDAKKQVTRYGYDAAGNRTSVTDANGKTTRFEYNFNGQIIKMIDALNQATEFTYGGSAGCSSCGGGVDKLSALKDANGNTTRFKYDPMGQMVQESDPLGHITSYGYNAAGSVTSKTDSNGNTIAYAYDPNGYLTAKTYSDGNSTNFSYDASGRLLSANNVNISYTYQYDIADRLVHVEDSEGRTIEYVYDNGGNRTLLTTSEGNAVEYAYDDAGRLESIKSASDEFTFGYDQLGRRSHLKYPNGIEATYRFDEGGNLTGLTHQSFARKPVVDLAYTVDPVGNRLKRILNGRGTDYGYDDIYRLTSANSIKSQKHHSDDDEHYGKDKMKGSKYRKNSKGEAYTYDPVGNRLTGPKSKDESTYNVGNELQLNKHYRYQYDNNGNMLAKIALDDDEESFAYRYDYENRLVEVVKTEEDDSIIVTFKYDPFGRRIEKKVVELEEDDDEDETESKVFRYFYGNEDILSETIVKEDDGTTKEETRKFVHGPGVDEPLSMVGKNGTFYYHADGLGSIVAMTDDQARNVQKYEYDSFGNQHDMKNRIKQPYGYTGREHDIETGLRYYRARYYDGDVGRFISKDPIGFSGGDVNLYGYVLNRPLVFIDPYGLAGSSFTNLPAFTDAFPDSNFVAPVADIVVGGIEGGVVVATGIAAGVTFLAGPE
ncbi:MAG: DUF6531 domain-containing protein, partial [Sulfurovum sp.]|nr:DUF6531 domain-containing protein [Sulfurovum sp.]